jgi:integrase
VTGRLFNEATARRFTIGKVGVITLADARDTARYWLKLLSDKQDPRTIEHATETKLTKEVTDIEGRRFCNVLAAFIAHKNGEIKKDYHRQMTNYLKRCCLPIWKNRLYPSITAEDIATLVRDCRSASGKGASRTLLSAIKTLDSWACSNGKATSSAAAIVNAKDVCGEKALRERDLTPAELKKVWTAARYIENKPEGAVYRLLILTACRLNEVAKAKWTEIDLEAKLWTIPKGRMKMKKVHTIPLTAMMITVFKSMKRGTAGDHIFSNNGGKTPVRMSYRVKNRMDAASKVTDWRNHDLRRTVRTLCSPLGMSEEVCERMLAHVKDDPYNKHQYLNEKRDGFERWNAELARIVGPQLTVVRRAA